MFKINEKVHCFVREGHPVLKTLRRETKRGKDLVIFKNTHTRNYVLAETNGRVLREIAVLRGFPRIPSHTMRDLIAQLRPFPKSHKAKLVGIQKRDSAIKEKGRNAGRTIRELMARVRKATKGPKKDHPAINWPKIPGEGV